MSPKALPEKRKLQFFYPSFFARCLEEAEKLSRVEQKDYSRLGWNLILTENQLLDFTQEDQLLDAFALLEEVLFGERELFWFLERPRPGKKGHQAKFWLFFDAELAKLFYQKTGGTPLDFRPEEVKALPPPDLRQVFLDNLSALPDDSPELGKILVQINRLMDLSQFYLGEEETEIPQKLREKVTKLAFEESRRLKKELGGSADLTTRLKILYGVVFRYFIKKNEVEQEYLQKLLEPDPQQRLKALNLCETRIKKELA